MTEFAWLIDWGPIGALVLIVSLFLKRLQARDAAFEKFVESREATLATIGKDCHDHAKAREERYVSIVQKNEAVFGQILTYLTRANGGP